MNEFQILQQAKYITNNAVWPGGANRVFGAVLISTRPHRDLLADHRTPLLIIRPGAGQADPLKGEEPLLFGQNFRTRLLVSNEHDADMEAALIGANRSGSPDSEGRGILEVQERLFAELGRVTGLDGMKILNVARSITDVDEETPVGSVAFRDYLFRAMIGTERFYHPATRFTAADGGGGDANLTWKLPPTRWDSVNVKILRKAGAVPPTGPADGTVVLASGTGVTHIDSPGAGQFSYGIFAAYDEDSETPTRQDIFSDGDSSTVTVT